MTRMMLNYAIADDRVVIKVNMSEVSILRLKILPNRMKSLIER